MARYQIPEDPRNPEYRPRRQRQTSREPIPWLWLGLGLLVTIISLFLAYNFATTLLAREPIAAGPSAPEVIRLTAPATAAPSPTVPANTPTPIPTLTPIPTPDVAVAPEEITVGYYARVVNTQNIGVTVRGGPSTDNVRVLVAPEGTIMLVIGGPTVNADFTWWQVRLQDGTEGWVAGQFITPAAAP
ncbi:MAG: SH3 domain-containing protein [Anaerolineae bacterium]|nr:SH3 domain-containing protein [Anaerolineae bacterium]